MNFKPPNERRKTKEKRKAEAIDMYSRGMTKAQIARVMRLDGVTVHHYIGCEYDQETWEAEMKAAIEFFGGLTPKQEYDLHTERRNALKQQYDDLI